MLSLKGNIIFVLLFFFSSLTLGFCESEFFDSKSDFILNELTTFASNPLPSEPRDDCHQVYSKLYNNDTLKVSFFLGVMDAEDGNAWDRPAKHSMIKFLTKECRPNYFACGFSQESMDPTVLQKTTTNSRNIIVTIHDSSVGDNLVTNNLKLLSEQENKSEQTKNLFLKSLERDDIVFYIGHSRYGTGLGFYWDHLFSSHWLSSFIRSPVLYDIIYTLDQTATPPKVFGIFSCSSERYYAKEFHSVAPEMALIVSNGITLHHLNVVESVAALNAIMGNLCYSEINKTSAKLNPRSVYNLYGLFENNKFPHLKKNNSLFSITIFILMLPIVIIVTSKLYPIPNFNPCMTKIYFKDCLLLLLSPVISLMVLKIFSKFYNFIDEQFPPIFFFLTGALLLIRFSYKQKYVSNGILNTFKASAAPLLLTMVIYFGINLYPAEEIYQLYISTIKSIIFPMIYFCLLPFFVFSSGIIKYPLFASIKLHFVTRILLFVAIVQIFYFIIAFSVAHLGIWIPHYGREIYFFFLSLQFISLLLYYYKSSILLSIIFQTLTLTLIFAEDIHGLFY